MNSINSAYAGGKNSQLFPDLAFGGQESQDYSKFLVRNAVENAPQKNDVFTRTVDSTEETAKIYNSTQKGGTHVDGGGSGRSTVTDNQAGVASGNDSA